jgi:hypothetical protein
MELGIESPVEAKSSGELPVGSCSDDHVAAGTWGRRGAAEKVKRRQADLGGEAEGAAEVKGRRDPLGGVVVDYLNTPGQLRRRRRGSQEGQRRRRRRSNREGCTTVG